MDGWQKPTKFSISSSAIQSHGGVYGVHNKLVGKPGTKQKYGKNIIRNPEQSNIKSLVILLNIPAYVCRSVNWD